jgi:flavodoxin
VQILVVYDSVFGNTEMIARSMAAALGAAVVPVGQANAEQIRGIDLLVVGSPTRGFRPTEGMVRFLNTLAKGSLKGIQAAAFDTRIVLETIDSSALRFMVDRGGYAAPWIARSLAKKGAGLAVPPEGFYVTGEQGPLKEGELERAASWAENITKVMKRTG